jgi:hypothetical protein
MPKKIQNFARSALVKPVTINVGRAGAASMNVTQVRPTSGIFNRTYIRSRAFKLCIDRYYFFIGSRVRENGSESGLST